MKYLLLLPVFGFYLLRDMTTLLKQKELVFGLELFVLTALVGLFASAFYLECVEKEKILKKIGGNAYKWLIE